MSQVARSRTSALVDMRETMLRLTAALLELERQRGRATDTLKRLSDLARARQPHRDLCWAMEGPSARYDWPREALVATYEELHDGTVAFCAMEREGGMPSERTMVEIKALVDGARRAGLPEEAAGVVERDVVAWGIGAHTAAPGALERWARDPEAGAD